MKIELQSPLSRLADALPYIFDSRTGIIGQVSEHPAETDSPRFFRYNCTAANTEAFGEYRNFAVGGGAAISREMALAKTIGEAIERYCAAIYDKQQFPLTSYDQAPFHCVHPARFALYSSSQYSYPDFMFDPFLPSSPVRWVPALDLQSQQQIHVPAAMVYVPYFFYQDGDETPICQPISTGLSCHCSFEEAAIGALCEVIERDCFMISWQARLSRVRLRQDNLSAQNKDLIHRFTAVGYQIHLMDISNESQIPAVLAVARHQTGYVPLVVAASVALSAEEAIRKALEELAHTERYAFQIKGEVPRLVPDPEYDNIIGQVDHVNYWVDPAHSADAAFLYASEQWRDFQQMPDFSGLTPSHSLQNLVQRLHQTGYQALVTDITTADVRELGMWVLRAVIPGYHPLFMGYHHRPLGGSRLWQIPQLLGFPGLSATTADYPFPHPFP
jgi:ribosomal protein S12 methylthiotransferase accessory factor